MGVHCVLLTVNLPTDSVFVGSLFVCLFCCLTSQVNSYGHCGTVSSPNHTFSWASLNKQFAGGGGCGWLVFFLVLLNNFAEEERGAGCFILFLLSRGCKCSVTLPHGAVGLSVIVAFPGHTRLLC